MKPVDGIESHVGPDVTVRYDSGAAIDQAAEAARDSDVAVVMVGERSSEGSDRPDLSLPGDQDALVEAVAEPLFPFGYGLSYTTFAFSHLTATPVLAPGADGRVHVGVDVTNTGSRTGAEVAQVYLSFPAAAVSRRSSSRASAR